jgi:hypothetical protein
MKAKILSIVVVIVVGVVFNLYNKAGASAGVQDEVYAILPQLTDQKNDPAYFRTLVDENHEDVFKRSYDAGGALQGRNVRTPAVLRESARRDGRAGRQRRSQVGGPEPAEWKAPIRGRWTAIARREMRLSSVRNPA